MSSRLLERQARAKHWLPSLPVRDVVPVTFTCYFLLRRSTCQAVSMTGVSVILMRGAIVPTLSSLASERNAAAEAIGYLPNSIRTSQLFCDECPVHASVSQPLRRSPWRPSQ